jgi:plastocyanin
VVAGSNISIATNQANDSLTINSTASGSGVTQNVFATVNADTGNTTANSDTDTLTIAGGTNVSTSISGDTLTINAAAAGGGSSTFSGTTDASSANLTVDEFYLPAITKLVVDNVGATAYIFDQYGSTNNPDVYAISGTTIAFDLNAIAGHPFLIQDPTGSNFNEGLIHVTTAGVVTTGASAQGKTSGTLYWKIPITVNGGYRYQCSVHAGMVGLISIKNIVAI